MKEDDNMDCKKFHELLSDFIDGRLDLELNSQIKGHLSQCPACFREYEEIRDTVSILRSREPESVPQSTQTRLETILELLSRENTKIPFYSGIAVATAVFAVIIAAVVIFNPTGKQKIPSTVLPRQVMEINQVLWSFYSRQSDFELHYPWGR